MENSLERRTSYRVSRRFLAYGCIWLIGLQSAFAVKSSSAVKDGIKLTVSCDERQVTYGGSFVCEIRNNSNSNVLFESSGNTRGLSFQLFDEIGNEITMDSEWEKMNSPKWRVRTKRMEETITPETVLTYDLHLQEAFGAQWKKGAKLLVEWVPGLNGNGDPILIGKGLSVAMTFGNMKPRSSPSGYSQVPGLTVPQANGAFKSAQWFVWAIGIGAMIGLIWLVSRWRRR